MPSPPLRWSLFFHLIPAILLLLHAAAAVRQTSLASADLPTHSNFLLTALQRRPQRHLWCGSDPNVCVDPDKNPWGGATTCCGRRFCRDTTVDRNNCGGCGMVCAYGLQCCGGRCVDSLNDKQHCGSCNNECPGQLRCAFGMCDYAS